MLIHILIADHETGFRSFLRRMIEREGIFEIVAEAPDGHQAQRLAEKFQPEVVILDMDMPQGDGLEAARQIKCNLPHSKVFMVSLLGDAAHHRAALANGADGFFSKARSLPELFVRLRSEYDGSDASTT